MTTREYLLDVARSKLGDYRKGSTEVLALWKAVVVPGRFTPLQIEQFAQDLDWCGVFVLACLREAHLTDTHWQLGSGFVLRELGAKTATETPEPGDIGIIQRWPGAKKDAWHHYLVEEWRGPNSWASIDGNSPGCVRKSHDRILPTTTFYSISRLLPALPEPGFLRGQEHSVPGVQDDAKETP